MIRKIRDWNGQERDCPSRRDVEALLEALENSPPGSNHDMCITGEDSETYLIVNYEPNSGLYYVSTSTPKDPDYMEIFDPTVAHEYLDAVIGGQEVECYRDSLIDLKTAAAAVLYFYNHEARQPQLNWRIVQI